LSGSEKGLSASIATYRQHAQASEKNNGWCYAVFLASDPQVKLFDGISDGTNFPAIPAPGNTVN
jgi:hypothetical protein